MSTWRDLEYQAAARDGRILEDKFEELNLRISALELQVEALERRIDERDSNKVDRKDVPAGIPPEENP